jgi:hypothetical protein
MSTVGQKSFDHVIALFGGQTNMGPLSEAKREKLHIERSRFDRALKNHDF